jgi:hypothetical protein
VLIQLVQDAEEDVVWQQHHHFSAREQTGDLLC